MDTNQKNTKPDNLNFSAADVRRRKLSVYFVCGTILIDAIGVGIFIPIFPKLLVEISHGTISQISIISGWLTFVYAIMQFFFAPVLGALSDKYGRKPLLLISLAALGVDYIFMALASTLVWLFIARIISGIMGASYTTATSYIADVSDDSNRVRNFGMIQAAFGAGMILGPVIGGLLGSFGTRVPFYFAAGLTLANTIFGFFTLTESLKVRDRSPITFRKTNPISSFAYFAKSKKLLIVALVTFLIYLSVSSFHNAWTYFLIAKFDWDERMIGYALGFFGIVLVLTQGVVLKPVSKYFSERKITVYGVTLFSLTYLLIAFANRGWMMFFYSIPFELGWLGVTAITSYSAKQVPDYDQGKFQGMLTAVMSIANILGPLVMNGSFSYFTREKGAIYFPGAPFFIASIFSFIALYICIKHVFADEDWGMKQDLAKYRKKYRAKAKRKEIAVPE